MGQVTHEYAFTSKPEDLEEAVARVNDDDSSLIDEATVYDLFNNKIETLDAEGRAENFTYGAFGRVSSAFGIVYTYDRFGR